MELLKRGPKEEGKEEYVLVEGTEDEEEFGQDSDAAVISKREVTEVFEFEREKHLLPLVLQPAPAEGAGFEQRQGIREHSINLLWLFSSFFGVK